jgi:hypothetical protein
MKLVSWLVSWSVGRLVGQSVGRSVSQSVSQSVRKSDFILYFTLNEMKNFCQIFEPNIEEM